MVTATYNEQSLEASRQWIGDLISGDNDRIKNAVETGNTYIRRRVYEDSFTDITMPPEMITDNSQLHIEWDGEKNSVLIEMEPDTSYALTAPYNYVPMQETFNGERYRLAFEVITSTSMNKDVRELRTYKYDLRKIVADHQIKELQYRIDASYIAMLGYVVGFTPNQVNLNSGSVHYRQIVGRLGREAWLQVVQTIPRLGTDSGLIAKNALMNFTTHMEFMAMGREEFGGDKAEKTMIDGVGTGFNTFMGLNIIQTTKSSLVEDGAVYLLGDEQFMGKSYMLQDTTMTVESKRHAIQFDVEQERGSVIVNPLTVARVDVKSN